MKKLTLFCLLALFTNMACAEGLGDSLRELRGTMNEITGAAREANEISKQVGVGTGSNGQAAAANSGEIKSGDTIFAKIARVKLYKTPDKKSAKLALLSKSEEVVFMGEEQNGMYKVSTTEGEEGWVDKLLVKKP